MTRRRITTGRRGEEEAVRRLEGMGYKVLERNYRCPLGEMDIVAQDGGCLVFIEVRSRTGKAFGDPLASVTAVKRQKLSRIAVHYLQARGLDGRPARFDVVAVHMGEEGTVVEVVKDAFDLWDGWGH
ncbi:MAG: YraN family protein [Syntrophales bacterium]|nr:YraN family protein [Syntrophales bacterium]